MALSFEERVAWALNWIKKRDDINNIQVAKILKVDKNTVQLYCHGKGFIKGYALAALVNDYKINGEWLISDKGEPFPGARENFPEVCGSNEYTGVRESPCGYGYGEFVFIKQVNGNISAGGGLQPDNSADICLAFRKEWFRQKGDPQNMSLIKVSGDSMEPTLLSGDVVLIDHSRNTIASQDGIYAISIDHEILIKRLHLLYEDSKILVISDNKQYPPQEINPDKITINGKVIWYAREIER
jgi:phage repressor protein C with HTH and peptisase S24 domain